MIRVIPSNIVVALREAQEETALIPSMSNCWVIYRYNVRVVVLSMKFDCRINSAK